MNVYHYWPIKFLNVTLLLSHFLQRWAYQLNIEGYSTCLIPHPRSLLCPPIHPYQANRAPTKLVVNLLMDEITEDIFGWNSAS